MDPKVNVLMSMDVGLQRIWHNVIKVFVANVAIKSVKTLILK